jgi:micrococcal nuclease
MKKVLIFALLFGFSVFAHATDYVKCIKVIDGDTIKIATGENVRLIGVDTPESRRNKKLYRDADRSKEDVDAIIAMGKESAKFTTGLVLGKDVRLEFDVQKQDRYGRLLAYVYLEDGAFVNAEIIKQGYGSPMTVPPNVKHADLFRQLYQEARENKKGLWQ